MWRGGRRGKMRRVLRRIPVLTHPCNHTHGRMVSLISRRKRKQHTFTTDNPSSVPIRIRTYHPPSLLLPPLRPRTQVSHRL